MFSKLKHIKELRDQAKTMQTALAKETVNVEKSGIKVSMNGNMEIISLSIGSDMAKESLEGLLTDVVNDAIKKTQRLMAQKIQSMGGLPNLG